MHACGSTQLGLNIVSTKHILLSDAQDVLQMQCGAVGLPRSKRTKDQLAKSILETMASGTPAFPLPTAGLIVPFKCPMCMRYLPFIVFLAGIEPVEV